MEMVVAAAVARFRRRPNGTCPRAPICSLTLSWDHQKLIFYLGLEHSWGRFPAAAGPDHRLVRGRRWSVQVARAHVLPCLALPNQVSVQTGQSKQPPAV